MTTEKYKRETAAARMLMTTICRKLVFRIRGQPTGEMLKCQEACPALPVRLFVCLISGLLLPQHLGLLVNVLQTVSLVRLWRSLGVLSGRFLSNLVYQQSLLLGKKVILNLGASNSAIYCLTCFVGQQSGSCSPASLTGSYAA